MILEKYLAGLKQDNESKQFGAPRHWRMSNLGKCKRQQVLQRLGFAGGIFSDTTLFIFQLGHMIEEMVMRLLGGTVIARQVVVRADRHDALGHADALVLIDNQLYPLEVKSTRNAALEYRIPYDTHKKQAAAYAGFLGLPEALLLYLGRDGATAQATVSAALEMPAIVDEWRTLNVVWEQLDSRLDNEDETSYYARIEKSLPPRLPSETRTYVKSGKWGKAGDIKSTLAVECSYCSYRDLCFPLVANSVGDGEIIEQSPN